MAFGCEAIGVLLLEVDPHALDFRVVVERIRAHLAPDARLLVTAKRRRRIEHVVAVDPHWLKS